ncbi:hypothetical protein BpHYR1_008425 [Brachionus plicatilis]|uniref:Uncharacterized protein n=1 Tax=Brachionus plicatilis TaxID=10195 RepID=A0A3M7SBA0_BRAPC|nr:hypothetical protein BpHYR1_008425 [Brachionus plicatilis]
MVEVKALGHVEVAEVEVGESVVVGVRRRGRRRGRGGCVDQRRHVAAERALYHLSLGLGHWCASASQSCIYDHT